MCLGVVFFIFFVLWIIGCVGLEFASNLEEKKFSHYLFKYFLISPPPFSVLWRLQLHVHEVTWSFNQFTGLFILLLVSRHFGFPKHLALSGQLRETSGLCLGPSHLCCSLNIFFSISWSNCRSPLFYFPTLSNPCLKLFHILDHIWLVVSNRKENMVTVSPFGLKMKVLHLEFC